MALSELLGFLSLMAFLALLGQACWKTWRMSRDDWSLYDHGFDKMPEVIKRALRYCLNRGVIVIEDRNSEHFIQFRKYILRNGEIGLELGFPEAPWSTAYFPQLRDTLTASGTSFRETREPYGKVTGFIHVDCGKDIDNAVDLAHLCFFEIFDLAPDTRFKSKLSNYSNLNDDVDDPDYVDPPTSEWWSIWRAKEQAEGRPDPALTLTAGAFTAGFLICYPALWVFWFLADRAPPEWQLEVHSFRLEGSHSTWILLLIFCTLVIGASRASRKLTQIITFRPRTLIDRIGGRFVFYGLPIAVVASWFGL